MAEPTLTQIFGAGATQTATTLTISKADLTGLTASANNSAESLFVGMLLNAMNSLTQANFDSNPDQSLVVAIPAFNAQTLVTRNDQRFRQHTINALLHKLDTSGMIDPDDY